MKFLVDRMLGKLAIWLRIFGYDTLYIADFNVRDEDTFMLENYVDRILLTRDKELYERCIKKRRKVILIKSDEVINQIRELVDSLNIRTEIRMDRCSVCNSILRKAKREEALRVMRREGIKEDLMEKYELWFCEKCDKLYWMGSHYRNMVKFLKGLEE